MIPRMLLSLLLFAVFQAAAAQPGLEVPENKPPRSRTTIAIGQYQSEFFFAKGDSNFVYGYAGPAPALVVTGEKNSVSLAYGAQPADSSLQRPGQRLIDLALQVNRVFGTALGLAIGYTYRAQQRYGGSVSAVRDAFGGLHAGSVDQRFQQHALRLGIVL